MNWPDFVYLVRLTTSVSLCNWQGAICCRGCRGLTPALVFSTPALLPKKEPRRGRISTPALAFFTGVSFVTLSFLSCRSLLKFSSKQEFQFCYLVRVRPIFKVEARR